MLNQDNILLLSSNNNTAMVLLLHRVIINNHHKVILRKDSILLPVNIPNKASFLHKVKLHRKGSTRRKASTNNKANIPLNNPAMDILSNLHKVDMVPLLLFSNISSKDTVLPVLPRPRHQDTHRDRWHMVEMRAGMQKPFERQ